MSITFTVTNAPRETETYTCQCEGEIEDCFECHGTGEVSFNFPAPGYSLNMANDNALNVLVAIGFEVDYCGTLEGASLDAAIAGCLKALNSASRRAVAVREPEHRPGGHAGVRVVHEGNVARVERMGAESYVGGYSDGQVEHRVGVLLDLCRKAKETGESIVWG